MNSHNDTSKIVAPKSHVVFVHGIFNTGRVFTLMVRDAKKHGFIPHAPSLKRADGRATMQELALQLKEIIDHDIPFGDNIVIVGFSMGGIVARVYLQRLGGTERVKKRSQSEVRIMAASGGIYIGGKAHKNYARTAISCASCKERRQC